MVYGAINEKGEAWYTKMGKVFDAIQNRQLEYHWLITDMDCVPTKITDYCGENEYCWITGEELTRIVRENDDQWVWAVLSGFEKQVPMEEVLRYPLPCANSYEGFWVNPPSIQHPLAVIEIVPWDSSLTLLFSKGKAVVEDFMRAYPLSQDLSQYNER